MKQPARLRALARARNYIGVKESPPGSNRGRLIDEWIRGAGYKLAPGGPGVPWCMCYLHAMFAAEGVTLGGWGSVERFEQWAAENGYLVGRPLKGDVVCYDWDSNGWADHVGIVERVLALRWKGRVFAGWISAVEGNTAVGNDSNGGQVMRRRRWVGTCKFARVA